MLGSGPAVAVGSYSHWGGQGRAGELLASLGLSFPTAQLLGYPEAGGLAGIVPSAGLLPTAPGPQSHWPPPPLALPRGDQPPAAPALQLLSASPQHRPVPQLQTGLLGTSARALPHPMPLVHLLSLAGGPHLSLLSKPS